MSVPVAHVSNFLEHLSHVIQYKADESILPGDVRDSIRILQQEVAILRSQLMDLTKYDHMESLQDIMSQITAIIAEAEDEVDGYLLRYVGAPVRGLSGRSLKLLPFRNTSEPHNRQALLNVGLRIRAVGIEVSRIHETRVKKGTQARDYRTIHHLDGSPNSNQASVSLNEEERVVGLEGATEVLLDLLTRGADNLEIISIVGMMGLGKTTLARKVFKDPNVEQHFKVRASVFVSQNFDRREVLLKILASFSPRNDEMASMSGEKLEKYLFQHLEGKEYLILLEDVWEKSDWDRLKNSFPKNTKRCRVLITTRNCEVGPNLPYRVNLDFLRMEHCRELLRWRVFRTSTCPAGLERYETEIAKKCDGLPLAVVAIAGILVKHKERVAWWKEVADSVRDYIAKDSEPIGETIALVYKNLPNYLKPCFLYLGVFPEDFDIPRWKLVQMWIGEGLILQQGNSRMEDTAEQYLHELVVRSLIMVRRRSSQDKIKTCHVPITMHSFCRRQAKKENLFSVIRAPLRNQYSAFSVITLNDHHRRISIDDVRILDEAHGSGDCLRSLISFGVENPVVESGILRKFKLLRVLWIPLIHSTSFLTDLHSLVLLTYLAISFTGSSLPSTLCNLWNLQTLVVNTTNATLEIRVGIWKMPRFRHLHSNSSIILTSQGPDTKQEAVVVGKNVQTLSTISPESCRKDIFDWTPDLRKLGIRGRLGTGTALFDSIEKLDCLENLKLINDDKSPKPYHLPSDKNFPKQLNKLTLWRTLLDWEEMAALGKLENLETLKLKDEAFQGKVWRVTDSCFLRLKHLYVAKTDLEVWEVTGDPFPELKNLVLDGCDQLQGIPQGLACITSFQSLVLHHANDQVASSAKNIEDLKIEEATKANKRNTFKLSLQFG